jgi:hypothetical protein
VKYGLKSGASVIALMLFAPGAALAAPIGECGVADISQNPNVVSCVSDPVNYQNGINYDQSNFATPAGLKLDIFGTAIVDTNLTGPAVSVTGSTDNAAQIAFRTGARVTNTGIAAQAQARGTGGALIDNRGIIVAGSGGLLALGDTSGLTGTATVTNQSDGRVTLSPTTGTVFGVLAQAGSASVTNNGQVSLSSPAGTGVYTGLAAGGYAAGGTATISNVGSVSLSAGGAADVAGLRVVNNSGGASISNTGSLSVSTGSGAATGMLVDNAGAGGPVTLTNTSAFSVSTSTGAATGMSVLSGTSVSLGNGQVAAGTTTFALTGVNLAGFNVANATGAVSLGNAGVAINHTAGPGGSPLRRKPI